MRYNINPGWIGRVPFGWINAVNMQIMLVIRHRSIQTHYIWLCTIIFFLFSINYRGNIFSPDVFILARNDILELPKTKHFSMSKNWT